MRPNRKRDRMFSEIDTTSGRIRGAMQDGTASFKAVPYGASTGGTNRFLPPRPATPWAGVRDALAYAGQAPQSRAGFARRAELMDFASPPDTTPETEDCLTLNLWTPGIGDGGRRPIMVWFHGGAFSFGSANSARLDGARLARREDVVVVTVNQRLNLFGFLDLSEAGGAEYAQSGNAGTLDMLAALEWVRDHAAAFGGDPGNVTIFGESGGGAKVSTLLAMPRARGLFHRAIVQSGAAIRLRTRERALRLTDCVLRELGAGVGDLAALPMERLKAAIAPAEKALGPSPFPLFDRYPFGPVVDGDLLPRHPFEPDAPDPSANIPLLVGDTTDEAALFLAQDDRIWNATLTEAELRTELAKVAGGEADRVVEAYRRQHPGASPARRLVATLTDSNFRIRSLTLAERRARRGGAPVWMYSFAHTSAAFDGRLGSPHAFDVPFTFDTTTTLPPVDQTAAAATLGATMSGLWAAFARTGTPDHAPVPHWPAYDAARRATLVLDAAPRIEDDPGAETRLLWREIAGA